MLQGRPATSDAPSRTASSEARPQAAGARPARVLRAAPAPRRAAPLRGREAELETLGARLAAVAAGQGGVLLVDGAAGIGKSALLAEAEGMALRAGVRVLSARGSERPQRDRFGALLLAALGAGADLRHGGDPRAGRGPELPYWVLHELREALTDAASAGPVAVVLDDLQWGDKGTLAALGTLPLQLAHAPLLWILASRPVLGRAPFGHGLSRLQRADGVALHLGPLGDEAVAQVIADAAGAPPDGALSALAATAAGSPRLLGELLDGLKDEGRVGVVDGLARLLGEGLPMRSAVTVRERLDRLSVDGRHVLRIASVLGPGFSVQLVATMLEQRPSELLAAFEELVRADLVVEDGERLAFRHELLRQAVLATLPHSIRRALRREAAGVLRAAGAPATEVADQLAASAELADAGDREAATALRDAARLLAGTDAGAAADHAVRALELLLARDPGRGALLAETVGLLHGACRPDEARALAARTLAGALPAGEEAAVRLSLSRMTTTSPLVRAEENRRALELPGLEPAMRARHLGWLAFNLATVDAGEATAVAAEAQGAARDAGDVEGRVMAALALACVDGARGHALRALERLDALRRETQDVRGMPCLLLAAIVRAGVLSDLGRVPEALALMADGLARARREGAPWPSEAWSQTGSAFWLAAGRLEEAREAAATSDGAADQAAGGSAAAATSLVTLAQVAVHTDDGALLRTAEAAAQRMRRAGTAALRRHGAWILALAAMARDDAAGAARRLADPELPYATPILPDDAGHEPAVARIALAAGDRELARRALAVAVARERENPGVPVLAAVARQVGALLAEDADGLLAAARALRESARPLLHAAAAEDAGLVLGRLGRAEEAVAALGEALDAFTACGATGDARRVRRLLRGHGVRPRPAAPERPTSGWASLTESELRVVRLVARGATNRDAAGRLFLSPHTVSSHVRHAFAKLGINSRLELTRLVLAEEGLADIPA